MFAVRLVVSLSMLSLSQGAFATDAIPACNSSGAALAVNNDQVHQWKSSTANQWLARAHVSGTVSKVYPDHSGHNHFEVQLAGVNPADTLEVIYNQSFGALPAVHAGMAVEACGDYITSNAPAQYPASPDGAIIHWIHKNPKPRGHESGFLMIDGTLYGQGNGHGG